MTSNEEYLFDAMCVTTKERGKDFSDETMPAVDVEIRVPSGYYEQVFPKNLSCVIRKCPYLERIVVDRIVGCNYKIVGVYGDYYMKRDILDEDNVELSKRDDYHFKDDAKAIWKNEEQPIPEELNGRRT